MRWNREARRLLQTARFVFLTPAPVPTVSAYPTPNPNSLKFTADGASFLSSGLIAFGSAREAEGHPLAEPLFALDGVVNVFAVPQFVTVTKHPAADWDFLERGVQKILEEYLANPPA